MGLALEAEERNERACKRRAAVDGKHEMAKPDTDDIIAGGVGGE